MIRNRFALIVFARLLLLAISMAALAYGIFRPFLPFTLLMLLVLSVWQFITLMKFINRTNDELAAFFTGIRYMDVMRTFNISALEKNFSNMRDSFNRLNQHMMALRLEKEAHAQLNQVVIDRIETGIIVFEQGGKVRFHNHSAAGILGVERISRMDLVKISGTSLLALAESLLPGKPRVVRHRSAGREIPISIKGKEIIVGQEQVFVLTLQVIRTELDQKEVESWQKLIRVLTHEMMNNITPVVTLSKNIERCLEKVMPEESQPGSKASGRYETGDFARYRDELNDAQASARMIEERSQSLLHFVHKYRSLTLLPEPDPRPVRVKDFLERQLNVFQAQFGDTGVVARLEVNPGDLEGNMDEMLMTQAITNLLKNAGEALARTPDPAVQVAAFAEGGQLRIRISDNGEGIPPENMDAVFVPFFSTKQGGSGVGLSLCKQIMALHQGAVEVDSVHGQGAAFTLVF